MKILLRMFTLMIIVSLFQMIFGGCSFVKNQKVLGNYKLEQSNEMPKKSVDKPVLTDIMTSMFRENSSKGQPELIEVRGKNIDLKQLNDFDEKVQNSLVSEKVGLPDKEIKYIVVHQFIYEQDGRVTSERKFMEILLSDGYKYIKEFKEYWDRDRLFFYEPKDNIYLLEVIGKNGWYVFK